MSIYQDMHIYIRLDIYIYIYTYAHVCIYTHYTYKLLVCRVLNVGNEQGVGKNVEQHCCK